MSGHAGHNGPVAFVAIWTAMMLPMMLPALLPALRRFHRAVGGTDAAARSELLTAAMAAAYYAVWSAVGVVVLAAGGALAEVEARVRGVEHALPYVASAVVLFAGAMQFSSWKAHHLARCREAPARGSLAPASAAAAWRQGLRLGVHCVLSCAGPMAALLAVGVMNPWAMGLVSATIVAERWAPDGARAARVTGLLAGGAGLLLVARAAGVA